MSRASSFDGGNYYKQLTSCLAAKNKLKVDLNAIPGYQHHLNNRNANRQPLITRQHIQAKFIAKYNAKKVAEQLAEQQANEKNTTGGSKKTLDKKAKPALGFIAKGNMGPKKQEDFINLPDTFFKSFRPEDIPDLPIFKIPKAPLKKAATPEFIPDFEPLPMLNQANISIATVNSVNFMPKQGFTSTPHEMPRAIICDPSDLGNYFTNPKSILSAPVRTFREKADRVFGAFGKVAEMMDTKCLAKYPHPLEGILGRLKEIYGESSRNPRLINETLMTESSVVGSEKIAKPYPSSSYIRPIPVFYESEAADVSMVEPDPLSETAKLFNYTIGNRQQTEIKYTFFETPAQGKSPGNLTSDFTFNSPAFTTPAVLAKRNLEPEWMKLTEVSSFASQPEQSETDWLFGTPAPQKMEVNDIFSPTGDIFSNHWNHKATASPVDNSFAIFLSPPKPRQRSSQRSQRERDESRRRDFQIEIHQSQPEDFELFSSFGHRSRELNTSQRSQREESRRSQLQVFNSDDCNRNSSLSTYNWTPNIGNTSLPTQSSRSHHYPFERRNIFKNSFDFV